jgi:NAD(P)H dehydrogenase (quinone)
MRWSNGISRAAVGHGRTFTPTSSWKICSRAARVLAEGPDHHGGTQYWLVTEMLNGTQATAEITNGLDIPMEAAVLTPDDLLAQVASGGMKMPAYVEATYGASILEWVRQTYEGRLNFGKVTSVVEDLTGNKPQTLETWVRANREAVLSAAS